MGSSFGNAQLKCLEKLSASVPVLSRERAHKVQNRAPHARIVNANKRLVELKAFATGEEFHHIAVGRLLGKAVHGYPAGRLFIKKLNVYTKHLTELVKPSRTNAVDALFILLNLLEGQTELFAELFLTHPKQHTTQPYARADVDIHGVSAARIVFFWLATVR